MKKVVLLGDSIREWYTNYVVELLKDKCEVISLLGDNGRFTYYSLFQLSMILKEHGKVDLVHFNNGYWDMDVMPFLNRPVFSLEEYKHGLKRIIELSRAAGADLIFATTTPLPSDVAAEDNTGTGVTFGFEQDRVKDFNNAAIELMKEENIEVNDLYAVCKQDKNFYKCEDNLHHTEEGNRVLAQHVANAILKELGME
ncbi:MAG: SGNH/GDSL hydrolase family protein [Ruminococcaceae bacterium]|nr:SGNH/GDSL hydrolase family protein [Oscillospiraceae bacterium]